MPILFRFSARTCDVQKKTAGPDCLPKRWSAVESRGNPGRNEGVKTTGIAGGLHWPYKGLRQRHLKVLERFANRISFTGCPPAGGRSVYLPLLTGSPVNGSLYSLSVNWSAAMSSCNWFATYSLIRFSFLPTVST